MKHAYVIVNQYKLEVFPTQTQQYMEIPAAFSPVWYRWNRVYMYNIDYIIPER